MKRLSLLLILLVSSFIGFTQVKVHTLDGMSVSTSSPEAFEEIKKGQASLDFDNQLQALEHFNKAIEEDKDCAMAYYLKSMALRNEGRSPAEIKGSLDKAVAAANNASEMEQLFIKSQKAWHDEGAPAALAIKKEIIDKYPACRQALVEVAYLEQGMGNFKEARETMKTVIEKYPDSHLYLSMADFYQYGLPKDVEKAQKYTDIFITKFPEDYRGHLTKGKHFKSNGELERALAAFDKADNLNPLEKNILNQIAEVNTFLGNYDAARDSYNQLIDISDNTDKLRFKSQLVNINFYQGNADKGLMELENLAASIGQFNLPKDQANLEQIITYYDYITAALELKKFEQASAKMMQMNKHIEKYAKDIGAKGDMALWLNSFPHYFEGLLAAKKGNTQLAWQKADKVRAMMSASSNPHKFEDCDYLSGISALMEKDYDKCLQFLEKVNPNDVTNNYYKAMAYEQKGDTEQAEKLYKKVVNYNSNNINYAMVRNKALMKLEMGVSSKD